MPSPTVTASPGGSDSAQGLRWLRAGLELLKAEPQPLLLAGGAVAVFVVGLHGRDSSEPADKVADLLANARNTLIDETLRTTNDQV